MKEKLGKFLCWMGLHNWRGWWCYGHGYRYRYRHNSCVRRKCNKMKSRIMHYQTANGGWEVNPTPYGRYVK